ncbi:MAG TPA: metallophosphoesterase [Ktedonobacteraceae bacterium]|nr:metallophosphoesterase [Ktedonobacteraceae bacterium]
MGSHIGETDMQIGVFGDVHGQILLIFQLAARWQQENGQELDLLLQVGDLGVFPDMAHLDRSTRRHSTFFPDSLGFLQYFTTTDSSVATTLNETHCPLVFVRGNHEDHVWLDTLEQQTPAPVFPIDVYQRVYCLKTGVPYLFTRGGETITLLGIGRIGRPAAARKDRPRYLQPDEQLRLDQVEAAPIDVLLTHDSARDQIYVGSGSEEIDRICVHLHPTYHFFGHYGGPCQYERVESTGTLRYKLAGLHPDYHTPEQTIQAGAMGLLSWHGRDQHTFTINCQERP